MQQDLKFIGHQKVLQILHWEDLQLDFILLSCVNKPTPPSKFDIDSLLYQRFTPQILCTSTEKPVDDETQLHCRPGRGRCNACRKCFSLVHCYGIKQYGLFALIGFQVDLQPAVSFSRSLVTLIVIVLSLYLVCLLLGLNGTVHKPGLYLLYLQLFPAKGCYETK